ncbi:MAG TPA: PTS fructose transporter subunit IIA [Ideonella sp.]|jgi:PTS system ascorbate-specific IIA component|nr:PTS fructose transporter subunit IIA [Ideonella sp.]
MPGLVIVAHAPLATALQAVASHVFAERAQMLVPVDVMPDWPGEQAEQALREAVQLAAARAGSEDVLILADVFGATPCNAAQRVAEGSRLRLIAGVNVPMLWRALAYADQPLDLLVERALAGGSQGVMPAQAQKPQDQPLHSQPDDPSHRHHQQ